MKRKMRKGVSPHRIDVYWSMKHSVMNARCGTTRRTIRIPRYYPFGLVRKIADDLEAKAIAGGAMVAWTHINGFGHSGTWSLDA